MGGVTIQRKALQNGWSHSPEKSALKWMELLSRKLLSEMDGVTFQKKVLQNEWSHSPEKML